MSSTAEGLPYQPYQPESQRFSEQLRRDLARWEQAAAEGDPDAIGCLGDLLWFAGRARALLEQRCGEAADRGDLGTMGQLRSQLLRGLQDRPGGGISIETQHREEERWYQRAAAAGSGAAIVHLARFLERSGRAEEAAQWLQTGSAAGHPDVMIVLAETEVRHERLAAAERWLRAAADAGSAAAAMPLARVLRRLDRSAEARDILRTALAEGAGQPEEILLLLAEYEEDPTEAELWLRDAVAVGSTRAMVRLAGFLGSGEGAALREAEQLLRDAIGAGWSGAHRPLGDLLARQGRTAEAQHEYEYDQAMATVGSPRGADLATVMVTASITAGVVPFVQALAAKAAEDSYHAVRRLIGNLLRSHGRRARHPAGTTGPVLLVTDPDTGTVLHLRPDLPDDALRALSATDLTPPTGRGTPHRLVWNSGTKQWEHQ